MRKTNRPIVSPAPAKHRSAVACLRGQQVSLSAAAASPVFLPETEYHYRVIATNANGSTPGPDQTFTTFPVLSLGLPDDRGYELVSPAQKNGGRCSPPFPNRQLRTNVSPAQGLQSFPIRALPMAKRWSMRAFPFPSTGGAVDQQRVSFQAYRLWLADNEPHARVDGRRPRWLSGLQRRIDTRCPLSRGALANARMLPVNTPISTRSPPVPRQRSDAAGRLSTAEPARRRGKRASSSPTPVLRLTSRGCSSPPTTRSPQKRLSLPKRSTAEHSRATSTNPRTANCA